MAPIKTYVFMDFATVKNEVLNRNRITELSLLAVHRSQYIETEEVKEPKDEKTFKFYRKRYSDDDQPEFNKTTFYNILSFIDGRDKPVCLIAYNGDRFDFPILRLKLQELKVRLPNDVMCADSRTAFRYILKYKNWRTDVNPSTSNFNRSSNQDAVNLEGATNTQDHGNSEDLKNLNMQRQNEKTPSKKLTQTTLDHVVTKVPRNNVSSNIRNAVRRNLFSSDELEDIYERVVKDLYIRGHPPENDNKMMLKMSQVFGRYFVDWVDENQRAFAEVFAQDVLITRKYE